MIDSQSIENLKQRLDIVDVVSSYLELKKNGANFKSVCPFHNDSNPSLVISPSKQIYHCFSCGAGGDSIKFVMEYEKLTYPETIEKLADMYNFSLSYTSNHGKPQENRKLMENLNIYYKKNLDTNKIALEYIKNRGIGESSVEKFEIGYAPSSDQTLNFLSSHGYTIAEANEVGVAGVGDRGNAYARFIERITFPIHSPSGKVVGFGGRTISNHPAKYVNSPQTKLFNKSYLLYGYHLAKETIHHERSIIITEGYLDVVMLHQAGFKNSVATLGTALTKEHIPLITRANPKVILAYDGDEAGVSAALKASTMLSQLGIEGGVVLFGEGMDPADMVQNHQEDTLNKLFRSPQPFVEFCIEKLVQKFDIKDPLQKQKALEEGSAYLKTLPSTLASAYAGMLSGKLNIAQNLVKVQTTHKPKGSKQQTFEDVLELTIVKTLLNKPSLVDTLLDTIDISMFKTHSLELSLVLNNENEHPNLRKILLDADIKIYDEDEMFQAMINFLIGYYNTKLVEVRNSKMDYDSKSFSIRKIQNNIFQLKQGKLVSYESI